MTPVAQFLISLGQALSAMALYGAGHPARTKSRERLMDALRLALDESGGLRVSFMQHDIIAANTVVHELRGWDWNAKFVRANVARLEVDALPAPTDADLDALLQEIHQRVASTGGVNLPAFTVGGMRLGALGIIDDAPDDGTRIDMVDALVASALTQEVDCVRWIHDEVSREDQVPMTEVEAVVQGLAMAMQRDQGFVLPLLKLKTQDQYTTTHSCNVAMLSMGLAEQVGMRSSDVRAIGTAALLHDIGKVRVSLDVLVKPGKLTEEEYAEMKRHTVEGARILGERGRGHALAAIVAYEHHVWQNGQGGYPHFRFPRACHYASRLVHVCDLYDALSTDRPYRKAWPRERTLSMLVEQRGIETDPELVDAFVSMVGKCEMRRQTVKETPQLSDWNAALARTASTYE